MIDLPNLEREDFTRAVCGVNAEGEQTQVAGFISIELLDALDRLYVADRLDLDGRSFLRVIGVWQGCAFRQGLNPNLYCNSL